MTTVTFIPLACFYSATLAWNQTAVDTAALIKISGRVYVDRAEFNKWLERQRVMPLKGIKAA